MKIFMKTALLLVFMCVGTLSSAQTFDDLKKQYPIQTVQQPIPKKIQKTSNTFEYSFCDEGNDGFEVLDLVQILNDVEVGVAGDLGLDDPRIVVGTSNGVLLEIDDILQTPTINVLCSVSASSFDVAVNSDGDIFTTNSATISQVIDNTTCDETLVFNGGGNSLSFDTQNNLYFNDNSQIGSAVYRLDAGLATAPYLWHDFVNGAPGGDFVILGNFMYIAWRNGAGDVLFRVTVDDDVNYVSHEEIGSLKGDTFGLASEQGVLYGVTPSEVYRIDFNPDPVFQTVILNDFTHGAWWGSAGFTEAIDLTSSAYLSQSDADANINPLPNPWTNTVSGGQTIYIRTEDIESGNFVVTPVIITLESIPSIAAAAPNLQACDADDNGIEPVDFTSQTALIMGSQDPTLYEVVYSNDGAFATTIADPTNYSGNLGVEAIFYRIRNRNNNECFSFGSFLLTVNASADCAVNLPPEISVSGRFPYCPQTDLRIAENFDITDPDDTGISQFSVQISSGYSSGNERLLLSGSHPNIIATWDATEGNLTLSPAGGTKIAYTDLIPAVRDIVYQSFNTNVSGEKFFSFNIGDANYLPATDHYYEYVEANLIDWESARIAAENRTYFGLQGYLATILIPEEAQLAGEQAAGTGWIGGSDAAQEGVWRWVTGPEAGLVFWNGGVNGTTPNFAFWNSNEPNNQGDEDYAHVTDPAIGIPGSWNDLPLVGGSGLYEPRGYIVEYGGMPGDPVLNISGSTSLYIPEIISFSGGEACPNEIVTLTAEANEGDVFWYDAMNGGNLLGTGNTFETPPLTTTTTFYAIAAPEGCPTSERVAVEATINPSPVVNNPVTLEFCDGDLDGFAVFDLTTANQLISGNFTTETFQFYTSEADAQNDVNAIADPTNYTNATNTSDTVWVRTISASNCFVISSINLEVTNTVVPDTFQLTYEECDDYLDANGNNNANNDDADGIATFNFSNATADIVNLFPTPQTGDLTVTYYESLADANNAVNPIADIANHRNINSPNAQQIFVRVDNAANATCVYVGTHITLNVTPVPVVDPITDFNVCDDDSDGDDTNGFVQNIDLESRTAVILGTQDPSLFTVTYHESNADAVAGSNPLTSPYTNTTVNSQTIFVRIVENASGCISDRYSFTLNIQPLPTVTPVVELQQCDTDTDGFSAFNLNEAASEISSNFMNETFEFFESLADAQAGINPIADPTAYTNQAQTSDTVWARAISAFGCYRISEVTLTVSTTGIPASFQRSFVVCDDFLDVNGDNNANNDDNDGITTFDFSSVSDEVRALFPPTQQLTITYYRNEADALAELNAIDDPTNYRNIGYPNTQNIYVRVDSDVDNDCLGLGSHITLTVDPVPVVNPIADIEACDDADDGDFQNGIIQTFDLTTQEATLLGSLDPTEYTVTYHVSAADALAGANAIATPTAYTNITPNQQTIYVRVTNNISGCFTSQTSFDLIVNELPIANPVPDLEICDDDSDGSARNGFSQSFDLELQTAGVLGGQDPNQFTVTYHASLANAEAGIAPLGSPFSNSVPFSQTIYVRVSNGDTGCANGISTFDVIVNPEPITEDVSNLSYCDDDLDGDDTNGFVQNIDLDSQILGILGPTQDENDFTVTFHESQVDASSGMNSLTTPYANTIANQQTIYVRVVNNTTGCVNDDYTFDVIVNPLPSFDVTTPQIVCLNGPDLTLFVENPVAIYDYVWTDPSGNDMIGPDITISSGGLYTVTATTTDGTACSRTRTIQVDESIVATITENDVTIVDDSDNNSITIDPTNLGIGDYEYALNDEDGVLIRTYQDEPLFENLDGGFYTILVRDKNGCGEASLEVSVIEFPKFFTPNNDGFNDTWAIKGANSRYFPDSEINIFNRFGKIVAKINIDGDGWDGTFNSRILPSDDYWFSIKLVDVNGNMRERKGNFSLLRR